MKKKIVLSGINLFSGGTLSIMQDILKYLDKNMSEKYIIIAFVYKKELYKNFDSIQFIEIPDSRDSWIKRVYYEYIYLKKNSQKIKPYLWLSMHDMTPNVYADKQAVYCHNPSPFYKMSKMEKKLDFKLRLFNIFYKYLYKINIKKNDYVIVQQDWIRRKFKEIYSIDNIIVAYPNIEMKIKENVATKNSKMQFFYAAFPRVFKNFEIICEAAKYFENRKDLEFIITIDGSENKYSRYLKNKYGYLNNLKFIGLISREEVYKYYDKSEALIFPSKLETWGLPITEYKEYLKPIFLADLEYARETIGVYDKVTFFNPYKADDLIKKIDSYLEENLNFEKTFFKNIEKPFTKSWKELFEVLLSEDKNDD